jgi:cell pole-organizing protein PopZ
MSTDKNDQEPSMEEILSSIRRIIADDEEEAAPTKPAPADRPGQGERAAEPLVTKPAPAPVDDEGRRTTMFSISPRWSSRAVTRGKRERVRGEQPFDSDADEIELEPEEYEDGAGANRHRHAAPTAQGEARGSERSDR